MMKSVNESVMSNYMIVLQAQNQISFVHILFRRQFLSIFRVHHVQCLATNHTIIIHSFQKDTILDYNSVQCLNISTI